MASRFIALSQVVTKGTLAKTYLRFIGGWPTGTRCEKGHGESMSSCSSSSLFTHLEYYHRSGEDTVSCEELLLNPEAPSRYTGDGRDLSQGERTTRRTNWQQTLSLARTYTASVSPEAWYCRGVSSAVFVDIEAGIRCEPQAIKRMLGGFPSETATSSQSPHSF